MRFLRPALMIALAVFCFSGLAMADDIHVVFDPTQPGQGVLNLITQTNTPYLVSWVSCGSAGVPSALANQQACLLFLNETGAPIQDLRFQFTANAALTGQTVGCASVDEYLTSNTCSNVAGELSPGEPVSVDFFGGQSIPNYLAFFFGETGVSLADAPDVTISVPTPEPGTLALMLAGLSAVGIALFLKK